MKKILITGATGLIGLSLIEVLLLEGYEVSILSRNKNILLNIDVSIFYWDIKKKYIDSKAFDNIDVIIHLAGENIGSKKWTNKRKKEILTSRVDSTNLLYSYVKKYKSNLKQFIAASAIGFYGTSISDEIFDETDSNGSDFLAQVCYEWEKETKRFKELNIKTVIIRTGVVLSKNGGILSKMIIPVNLGLNSAIGTGKQNIPWIHILDLCNIYLFAITEDLDSVYNCVSNNINNREFSKELSKTLNKPFIFPNIPAFLIKLIFGDMSIIILEGNKICNKKITKKGFIFKYVNLNTALKNLYNLD